MQSNSELRERYKSETGRLIMNQHSKSIPFSDEYVLWLEDELISATHKTIDESKDSASDYLIKQIKSLSQDFQDIKIRYEYSMGLSTHLIEILPLNIFENDISFGLREADISDEFDELFGHRNEEVLFVSSDSLVSVKNPTFVCGY